MKKLNTYIMIKVSNEFKQKIIKKSEEKSKNLSEYVRDLIVKDLEK